MVNECKVMSDQLSDFNSCVSELSSENSGESADEKNIQDPVGTSWTTMNERKRKKRNKRKNSLTPNKDEFLKKQNMTEY